jgi:single-strand DNA-binding protein
MSGEPVITVVGNAAGDAEMKFLPSGVALCSFTVVSTPRVKQGDSWVDGEPTFYRCTAWRQLAESAGETITRGMRLIVQGRLTTRSYETSAGEKRLSVELDVDAVGPELRYATAKVNKVSRGSGAPASSATADPWAGTPVAAADDEDSPF